MLLRPGLLPGELLMLSQQGAHVLLKGSPPLLQRLDICMHRQIARLPSQPRNVSSYRVRLSNAEYYISNW